MTFFQKIFKTDKKPEKDCCSLKIEEVNEDKNTCCSNGSETVACCSEEDQK
ncbi:MAG: hypothetical protein H0Z32_10215 [Bacillaceae bacterium]|nr:hypothetical protein [Bacillaceae bacterium]